MSEEIEYEIKNEVAVAEVANEVAAESAVLSIPDMSSMPGDINNNSSDNNSSENEIYSERGRKLDGKIFRKLSDEEMQEIASRTKRSVEHLKYLRPFKAGVSANPGGLPRKKKLHHYLAELPQKQLKNIIEGLADKAESGKMEAIKILLNQSRKDGANLNAEPIENEVVLKTDNDIVKASELIINNAIAGLITPAEAAKLMSILTSHKKLISK